MFCLFYYYCHYRSQHRRCQKYVFTLMLIPPGIDFYAAMAPIREEIKKLEAGIEIMVLGHQGAHKKTIKGSISCLIGDHPQGIEYSRHLGVGASLGCRFCTVCTELRSCWVHSILEYKETRRREQTDVIVRQIREEKALEKRTSYLSKISTKYGIGDAKVCFCFCNFV